MLYKGKDSCLIIAEAGVNHNGDFDTAIRLCNAAKEAGADVVKFQTWRTEKIITSEVEQAEYQANNTGKKESQFDMLKRLELPYEDFAKLKKHCDDIGIIFSSTADEEEGLDFLISIGIPFIKVGSGDVGNISYLRYVGEKNLPVILSTGMSTIGDIDRSVCAIKESGQEDITLLHCTTNYPCPMEEVNLNAMRTLKTAFQLPVGYSDHTLGSEVAVAATALGACVIEKHFTLDRNMNGPDHKASTEPEEFEDMVKRIRNIEKALGDGIKQPAESEKSIAEVVRKRIVAKHTIKAGDIIGEEDICVKRSAKGALAESWDAVMGTVAGRDYKVDEGIG